MVLFVCALSGCGKEGEDLSVETLNDLPAQARQNNLANLPGLVHSRAADSPIHWQPWTHQSVQIAEEANRMIFVFVAMAQASGFSESLDALAEDPALVHLINSTYLPMIIDGDAAREIGMLAADLSLEINQNVNLPFFIWMSPKADPVAWISSPWVDSQTTRDHFRQSHGMVERIWNESPEYVVNNSVLDNQSRYDRISRRRLSRIESEDPKSDTVRSIRQLTSLYDPLSRNHDEIGGLFPVGALDLLASAAMQPDLPENVRRSAVETTRELVKDLLSSAMFDPLDGGLFSARRGTSWLLPRHSRHSMMQSRAAVALFRIYQATGEPLALERALGLLEFSERNYQTDNGLFAIGEDPKTNAHLWMWSMEDVEQVLGEDEGRWWASLTNMRPLGNIPYENDPQREFFRTNSIFLKHPMAGLAENEGVSLDAFKTRFNAARDKLLEARAQRLGGIHRDENPFAVACFRMVSAYAAAYAATGDDAWRSKAVELLRRSREAFSNGAKLRNYPVDAPLELNDARAFVYAVAIQSILDVVEVTSDLSWLDWSDNLATVMTEEFTNEGFLREAAENTSVLNLPMTDLLMLFEDSTVGLLNFAECRLAALQRPLLRDLRELAGTLPVSGVDYPVQHTDVVQAFLARIFGVVVVYGETTSPEMMERIERLPIRMFHRRPAVAGESLPDGGCLIIRSEFPEPIRASNPSELENALLPIGERRQ